MGASKEITFGAPVAGDTLTLFLPKQLVNDKATTAVSENDFPVMTGSVLLFAVFYTVIIFLSDLTYGLVDPRIRYS